jgi:hypothetical protein
LNGRWKPSKKHATFWEFPPPGDYAIKRILFEWEKNDTAELLKAIREVFYGLMLKAVLGVYMAGNEVFVVRSLERFWKKLLILSTNP